MGLQSTFALCLLYPTARCSEGVIEAAERGDAIKCGDGDQLLAVALLIVDRALYVLLEQGLQMVHFSL